MRIPGLSFYQAQIWKFFGKSVSPECQAESKEVPANLMGLCTQWSLSQTSQGNKVKNVWDCSANHKIHGFGLGGAFEDHQVQPPAAGKHIFHWITLLKNHHLSQQKSGVTLIFMARSKQDWKRSRKSELCRLNYFIVISLRKRIWKGGGSSFTYSWPSSHTKEAGWHLFIWRGGTSNLKQK